jgi:hypothetical protein
MLNLSNAHRGALPVRSPVIDQLKQSTLSATAAMCYSLSNIPAWVKRREQFRRSSVGRRGLRAHFFRTDAHWRVVNCFGERFAGPRLGEATSAPPER